MKNPPSLLFLISAFLIAWLDSRSQLVVHYRDTSVRFEGITFNFKNLRTGYREAQMTLEVWNSRDEPVMIKSTDIILLDDRGKRAPQKGEDIVVPPISRDLLNLTYALDNKTLSSFTMNIQRIAVCYLERSEDKPMDFYSDNKYIFENYEVSLNERTQQRSGTKTVLNVILLSDRLLEVNHRNIIASYGERKIIRHKKSGERPFYLCTQNSPVSYDLFFPKVPSDSTLISMKNVFRTYKLISSTGFAATFKGLPTTYTYDQKDIDKIE